MIVFQPRAIAAAGSSRGIARLARSITQRARETDVVGWFGGGAVCAILHQCDIDGARRFIADVCGENSGNEIAHRSCRIYVYPSKSDTPAAGATSPPRRRHDDDQNGNGNGSARHASELATGQDLISAAFVSGFTGEMAAAGPDNDGSAPIQRIGLDVGEVAALLVRPMPWWKRSLDIALAGITMTAISPVMLAIALGIKLTSPGPVIFKQRRRGLGGKAFTLYKFRTMVVDAEKRKAELRKFSEQDGPAFKMTHDPRVTRIGRFLRTSSLDELPQLWNVLKGDMSLVGPRPLPCDEMDACEQWQRRRLDITPGITCIWQVKGRSTVTFTEWIRMDLSYLRARRLATDLLILLQTIPAVLFRRGAR
jgi:lipopolysaccharide/colanic/teichoic acid biosynthesis glycosyltransferase